MKGFFLTLLIMIIAGTAVYFIYKDEILNAINDPEPSPVEVAGQYATTFVYVYEEGDPIIILENDCRDRGGTFNQCGPSSCSVDAFGRIESCTDDCTPVCEVPEQDTPQSRILKVLERLSNASVKIPGEETRSVQLASGRGEYILDPVEESEEEPEEESESSEETETASSSTSTPPESEPVEVPMGEVSVGDAIMTLEAAGSKQVLSVLEDSPGTEERFQYLVLYEDTNNAFRFRDEAYLGDRIIITSIEAGSPDETGVYVVTVSTLVRQEGQSFEAIPTVDESRYFSVEGDVLTEIDEPIEPEPEPEPEPEIEEEPEEEEEVEEPKKRPRERVGLKIGIPDQEEEVEEEAATSSDTGDPAEAQTEELEASPEESEGGGEDAE